MEISELNVKYTDITEDYLAQVRWTRITASLEWWNVLKGEMNLVGPHRHQLGSKIQARCLVCPLPPIEKKAFEQL